MAGNPMGRNGMVRPGPSTGSPFAGGSFSPRRRMTAPTPGAAPAAPQGQRTGWGGAALPPGQMKRMAAGKSLNAHWSPIAQQAGLMPQPGATTPAATHTMPDGSTMPGASHAGGPMPTPMPTPMMPMPQFPQQAQGPYPGFMPPGLMRPGMGRRTVMPQPYDPYPIKAYDAPRRLPPDTGSIDFINNPIAPPPQPGQPGYVIPENVMGYDPLHRNTLPYSYF